MQPSVLPSVRVAGEIDVAPLEICLEHAVDGLLRAYRLLDVLAATCASQSLNGSAFGEGMTG